MRVGRMGAFCAAIALAAGVTGSVGAAIVVLTNGEVGEGRLISKDDQEIVFHAEGAANEVHLALARVSRIVETDEHGGATSLATHHPPTWNIPVEPASPPVGPPASGPTYYLVPLHGEVGATIPARQGIRPQLGRRRRNPSRPQRARGYPPFFPFPWETRTTDLSLLATGAWRLQLSERRRGD